MKKILRLLALLIFAGALVTWLATGANRGWTKTSAAVKTLDEVTGIEGITYENRFAPGLDFLGAVTLVAGILTGVSFLLHKQNNQTKNPS